MTQTTDSPHYIVQLPEGDCELDAGEICRRCRLRQINFSTMVRPVEERQFRRLDEDAAFAPALAELYRWQRKHLGFWLQTLSAILIVPVFLLPFAIFPMIIVGPMMIYLGVYLSVMLCHLVRFCRQSGPADDRFHIFGEMLIPYYNSFAGYRLFRQFAQDLPQQPPSWWRTVNAASWLLLGLFYAGCVLLPHGRQGTTALTVILFMLLPGLVISAAPFWRQLCLLRRDWLNQNPKPAACKAPLPAWAKSKFEWDFKEKLTGLFCIALFIVVYLAPYYIVGELRYHYELSKMPWPVAQPPVEFTEKWNVPEFPCKFTWISGPGTLLGNLPDDINRQLAEALPQLEQVRDQLKCPLPPGDFLVTCQEEKYSSVVADYVLWRFLQYQTATEKERPELIQKLFLDLDQMSALAKLGLTINYDYLHSCDCWRTSLLEATLPQLSLAQLQHQKEYWQKNLDTDLVVNTAKISYQDDFETFSIFDRYCGWIYACFGAGVLADILEDTRQSLPLIYQDPYRVGKQLQERQDVNFFLMIFEQDNGTYLNQRLARMRAVSLLALSAIKLEEFRRANGQWPEHPELPPDPFDGQMLRYQDGKRLYSIGSDGIDNGGDDSCRKDKQGDIVFYLSAPGA